MRSSTWCCLKTAVAVEQRWSQPSPAGSSCRNSTLRRRLEDQLVSHPSSSPLISDFARQTCPSSLSPMILMLSSIKALTPRQDCPNKVFLRSWPEVQKHWYPSHLFHIIHLFFFHFLNAVELISATNLVYWSFSTRKRTNCSSGEKIPGPFFLFPVLIQADEKEALFIDECAISLIVSWVSLSVYLKSTYSRSLCRRPKAFSLSQSLRFIYLPRTWKVVAFTL